MKLRFTLKPAPTTWLSLFLLVLMFPLGLGLPDWCGWENGPLENLQVVILFSGMLISWVAANYNRNERKIRNFWLWLTPFWLLCIGRELSWGRVFYPVSIGTHGPEFISIYDLWYGPLVRPLIAVAIIAMLIGICRCSPLKYLQQTAIPLFDVIFLFLTVILSALFDKSFISFLKPWEEVLEEWAELVAYWSMVSIIVIMGFQKKSNTSSKLIKKLSGISSSLRIF